MYVRTSLMYKGRSVCVPVCTCVYMCNVCKELVLRLRPHFSLHVRGKSTFKLYVPECLYPRFVLKVDSRLVSLDDRTDQR